MLVSPNISPAYKLLICKEIQCMTHAIKITETISPASSLQTLQNLAMFIPAQFFMTTIMSLMFHTASMIFIVYIGSPNETKSNYACTAEISNANFELMGSSTSLDISQFPMSDSNATGSMTNGSRGC